MPLQDNIRAIVPGTTVSGYTNFLDQFGNPVISDNPATWSLIDFNGNIILTGNAIQDPNDTSIWNADIAIPASIPVPRDNSFYKLVWTIQASASVGSGTWVNTDTLSVVQGNPPDLPIGVVILNNAAAVDYLNVPQPLTSFDVQVLSEDGTVLYDSSNQTNIQPSTTFPDHYQYMWSIPARHYHERMGSHWIQWNYVIGNGATQIEIHPLWIAVPRAWRFLSRLKAELDKIRDAESDPNLRWNDSELMQHIYNGLDRVNGSPPHYTYWNLSQLPPLLEYPTYIAAAVSALQARYLAEGMLAFEFTGQSSTLTIDRTQYISALMDNMNSWLDSNLTNYKRTTLRRGVGMLHVTVSPVFNLGSGGKFLPVFTEFPRRGGWI